MLTKVSTLPTRKQSPQASSDFHMHWPPCNLFMLHFVVLLDFSLPYYSLWYDLNHRCNNRNSQCHDLFVVYCCWIWRQIYLLLYLRRYSFWQHDGQSLTQWGNCYDFKWKQSTNFSSWGRSVDVVEWLFVVGYTVISKTCLNWKWCEGNGNFIISLLIIHHFVQLVNSPGQFMLYVEMKMLPAGIWF